MSAPSELGFLITQAHHAVLCAKEAALAPTGLTVPQYTALLCIADEPGISGADLAHRCIVTPQTMTTVLGHLESKQLVRRESHPFIGSVIEIHLTAAGRRALMDAHARASEVESELTAGLTRKDRVRLADELRRCIDALAVPDPTIDL
jgi:DNA-binding MarR family transcriptional regulator